MKSTVGRPRKVTDAQIKAILEWHEAMLAWQAQRSKLKTITQLAAHLGLSRATISAVIKRRGEFKQPSPEERDQQIQLRHERMQQLSLHARRMPAKGK